MSIFFDLSKAFDRAPHCQLISTLSNIGVSGPLLERFHCYLANRFQKVVLDGHSSTTQAVTSGVPQGSILGPLLFSIYMNPLTTVPLSHDSSLILLTDDIILYRPIRTLSNAKALQSDVDGISNWVRAAGLTLNTSKTKVMIFSHKRNPLLSTFLLAPLPSQLLRLPPSLVLR